MPCAHCEIRARPTMQLDLLLRRKIEAEVRDIVGKHVRLADVELFFFGSRVDGTAKESSDLDIGIRQKSGAPLAALPLIQEQVFAIDSPIRLDFVDFAQLDASFQDVTKNREPF